MSAKTPRQTKTPAQRAQEQLDTATRLVTRLENKISRLRDELTGLSHEYIAAERRREHLSAHPDLVRPETASEDAAAE